MYIYLYSVLTLTTKVHVGTGMK